MSNDSFAAAQARILARQTLRQAEAERSRQNAQAAASDTVIARLPHPLNQSAAPFLSFWQTLVSSEGTKPAIRVGQVDAELLDEELLSLLRGQVGEALKYFGTHVLDDWSHEITLLLRAVLFKLSIWDHDASYGAALQNLRFTDGRRKGLTKPSASQKGLYGLITVLGRYGWDKWEDWLIEQEGGYNEPTPNVRMLSRLTAKISTCHSVAAFVSFIIFLINGRYRTLTDRLLRLKLIAPVSQISREVSFEYLNRQLVWHAFTEFLLFLLPLVGISRWKKWLSRMWKRTKAAVQIQETGAGTSKKQGPLSFLPERTCAICYQDQHPTTNSESEVLGSNIGAGGGVVGSASTDVVNPYATIPCGCVYCFVCIATRIEAEEGSGWPCLRCGTVVHTCKPWSGDVLERKPKSTNKTVGFAADADSADNTEQKEESTEPEFPSELESSQWALEGTHDSDEG